MNKFFAPALILVCLVFLGAGCVNFNLPFGQGGAGSDVKTQKEKADFCKKHVSDAEAAIKKQVIAEEDNKVFEIWKRVFFKANGINEDFFDKYIFPSVSRSGSNYSIGYYYKVGDMYLRSSGDKVIITYSKLDYFQTSSVPVLLEKLLPPKTGGFNEPHPDLGDVPKFGINNFDWGSVTVTKLKMATGGKTPPILICREYLDLLKTCRADIEPGTFAFKPALGGGWLMGFSANYYDMKSRGKKECAGADIEIFTKKMNCYVDIECTAGIIP